MIRFLLRVLATLLLAVAVVLAVVDATRSIAASRWAYTTLAQSWETASPGSLQDLAASVAQTGYSSVWNVVAAPLLTLPAFAIFAVLAFIFFALGRRRRHLRSSRYASA